MRIITSAVAIAGATLLTMGMASAQQTNTTRRTAAAPRVPSVPGIVKLFTGKAEDMTANWVKNGTDQPAAWKIEDGAMVVGSGDIATKEKYENFQLHIEFKEPDMPNAKGQAKGNSGVFLQGRYELQVLDSFGVPDPGRGDCGAMYNAAAPLVKAYRQPGQWQTYDISFRQAKVDAKGRIVRSARVTVLLNGVVIQNNTEMPGVSGAPTDTNEGTPGRIRLQDHGCAVAYRNIWILPLPAFGAVHY